MEKTDPSKITYNIRGNDNIGQIRRDGGALTRYYYLKDHLGTIKMTVNTNGNVVGYDDYYPYGEIMPGRSSVSSADDRYKFTGKERDEQTGYDYFGARYYDSWLGRWLSVDPAAKKYPGLSPYNYVNNNPVRLTDPDGKASCCDYPTSFPEFSADMNRSIQNVHFKIDRTVTTIEKKTVGTVSITSDNVSEGSMTLAKAGIGLTVGGAVISFAGAPEVGIPMMGIGRSLTRFSLTVSAGSEVTSAVSKGVNIALGGSKKEALQQFEKTSVNTIAAIVLDKLIPVPALVQSEVRSYTMSAARDATKVMSVQVIDNKIDNQK